MSERCKHGRYIDWEGLKITCRACEDETRAAATLGYIGPLEEHAADRCPWCGLDPLDATLHAPDCSVIVNGNCGCMQTDTICLQPDVRGHPHVWRPIGRKPA